MYRINNAHHVQDVLFRRPRSATLQAAVEAPGHVSPTSLETDVNMR